jgi:hypothetical protein
MPGQRLHIFNALSAALSQHGVASIRHDKRGCGMPPCFTDLLNLRCWN